MAQDHIAVWREGEDHFAAKTRGQLAFDCDALAVVLAIRCLPDNCYFVGNRIGDEFV